MRKILTLPAALLRFAVLALGYIRQVSVRINDDQGNPIPHFRGSESKENYRYFKWRNKLLQSAQQLKPKSTQQKIPFFLYRESFTSQILQRLWLIRLRMKRPLKCKSDHNIIETIMDPIGKNEWKVGNWQTVNKFFNKKNKN
ncbi:hypothetical protein [Flavitalea sp.]|nr:hypothetical protein [Flavitalea sp.]